MAAGGMAAGGMAAEEMGSPGGSAIPPGGAEAGSSSMAAGADAVEVDPEWQKKLAGLVERFVEISRRPDADFFPDPLSPFAQGADGTLESVFETAAIADARRLDDAEEYDQALERYLALIRFARHYQQRGDAFQIGSSVRLLVKVYEQLLARAVRIEQSKESLLAMSQTLDAPPYDFLPDHELSRMREYVRERGIAELNPVAWKHLAARPYAQYARLLLTFLPWERTRSLRLLDYTSVIGRHPPDASARVSQWRKSTLIGGSGMDYIRTGAYESLLLTRQRAALQLRLLLLAYKAEHGELPPSLVELDQAFPGQVQPDPSTGQPWIYRPQGDPTEQELQRPFISSPARYSSVNFANAPRNFVGFGEVFFIEPPAAQ
jgi:hypothetical protein